MRPTDCPIENMEFVYQIYEGTFVAKDCNRVVWDLLTIQVGGL